MSNNKVVIYHNPRCSKSRETLQILQDNNVDPEIIDYQEPPPSAEDLRHVIALLEVSARDLLRTTEQVYQDANLEDDSWSEDEIVEAICRYPSLLRRPIVISGNRAVFGRPPSRVLEIIA